MAHKVEEALTLAEPEIRFPGCIVRPSFAEFVGWPSTSATGPNRTLARQLALAINRRPRPPCSASTGTYRGRRRRRQRRRAGANPGPAPTRQRAGVHSGTLGVFPPQTVSEGDQALIVATMERIVLALGGPGLVNAQFIVREDGVYLIEVTPARRGLCRSCPRSRCADGRTGGSHRAGRPRSPELGWHGATCRPRVVAVKAPAFSTAELRGVDPRWGPACSRRARSSGSTRSRVALAKASLGRPSCRHDRVRPAPWPCCRIADRDKALLGASPAGSAGRATGSRRPRDPARARGGGLRGRAGRQARRAGGRDRRGADPRGDRERRGPARRQHADPASGAVRDAAEIRHAATAEGILCLTAIETAVAAAEALDPALADRLATCARSASGSPAGSSSPGGDRLSGLARHRWPTTAKSAAPAGVSLGVTTIAWPSAQNVSVVSATMTTASGTWRSVASTAMLGGASSAATTWPAHAPNVAADDGRELDGPHETRRHPCAPVRRRRCRTGPSPAGAGRRWRR